MDGPYEYIPPVTDLSWPSQGTLQRAFHCLIVAGREEPAASFGFYTSVNYFNRELKI